MQDINQILHERKLIDFEDDYEEVVEVVLDRDDDPIGVIPLQLDTYTVVPVLIYADRCQLIPAEADSNGMAQCFSSTAAIKTWAIRRLPRGAWIYDHDKGLRQCLKTGRYLEADLEYVNLV